MEAQTFQNTWCGFRSCLGRVSFSGIHPVNALLTKALGAPAGLPLPAALCTLDVGLCCLSLPFSAASVLHPAGLLTLCCLALEA